MIFAKQFSLKNLVVVTIIGAVFFLSTLTADASSTNWDYRIKVTIDGSKVVNDLEDFPIYINLADLPADFHTNVRSDGGDIRVTKADGKTELAREIVFYSSSTDAGELHFKNTGTLSSATDTDFYIYYGNSGAKDYSASSTYGRNNVWTDYEAVYHLEGRADSTGKGRTLSQQGKTIFATTSQKLAGKYADFGVSGGNSLYRLNDNFGLPPNEAQSWSFWYKIHSLQEDNYDHIMFSKASENNGGYGWYVNYYRYNATNPLLTWTRMRGSDADGANLTESIVLATSTWYHSAQTFDGSSTIEGWRNGISKGTAYSSGSYSGFNDQGFTLGGWWVPTTKGTLKGAIDEFRLYHGKYPSGWVETEYNNHNSPNLFYKIGSQEVRNWY